MKKGRGGVGQVSTMSDLELDWIKRGLSIARLYIASSHVPANISARGVIAERYNGSTDQGHCRGGDDSALSD